MNTGYHVFSSFYRVHQIRRKAHKIKHLGSRPTNPMLVGMYRMWYTLFDWYDFILGMTGNGGAQSAGDQQILWAGNQDDLQRQR